MHLKSERMCVEAIVMWADLIGLIHARCQDFQACDVLMPFSAQLLCDLQVAGLSTCRWSGNMSIRIKAAVPLAHGCMQNHLVILLVPCAPC